VTSRRRPLRIAGTIVASCAGAAVIAYGWALARVAGAFAAHAPADADAVVVLGAAVWPNGPSPALVRRTRAAYEILRAGRVRWIVTTGGLGAHPPAEGEASRTWLEARGIPAGRVLVENRSHTTWENLALAAPSMRAHGIRRVIIVSDGYHLARGVSMARDLGFDASGESADGPPRDVITRDPMRWLGEAALYLGYVLSAFARREK
jgi:uncharacterized SAM-binding protein YcdF (DUF218 family)